MKKMFEIEYMKHILLTKPQREMLKYQYKYINFNNHNETTRFLDFLLGNKVPMTPKLFEDDGKINIDEKLIEGINNYYNY